MGSGDIHGSGGAQVRDLKRPLSVIFAGLVLCAIFVGSLLLVIVVYGEEPAPAERDLEWWQRSLVYHVYVPSYYDSDGDGLGDLKGRNHLFPLNPPPQYPGSATGRTN